MNISFTVNGTVHKLSVRPDATLLTVLRDELDLIGAKHGCDGGECGACTVLLEGQAVSSCTTLAVAARDRQILTVEGLAQNGHLHPLQKAFVDCGALQCGFCGGGMLMAAKALLDKTRAPSRDQVKRALAGNLCRCSGYQGIIDGVLEAAAVLRGEVR
jgi:carbon-monoxide dehydrogenase small subunit